MSNIIPITYAGAVPGANSNDYTLFDSLARWGHRGLASQNITRYVASFGNPAAGTIKAYASTDGTTPTKQFYERFVMPQITKRTNDFEIPIVSHGDILVTWTNAGVAQTGWYVSQALVTGDEVVAATGYDDILNLVSGNMAHSVTTSGGAINVGPNGQVLVAIQWASTGSPVGTFTLEYTRDATTWRTVPNAAAEFTNPSGAVAGNMVALWRELQTFRRVRVTYTSTSGGTANTTLAIQAYTR